MKICAISDTHGIIKPLKFEEHDLLLIAGDTVDLYVQRDMTRSREWYKEKFIPWINDIPCKKVIMIGGNHDFYLEKYPGEFCELIEGTKISYIQNEYIEYDGITIYGTPLCHEFYNWAFMPTDDAQRDLYKKTMRNNKHIDILLAHDAPYGYSDICYESSWGRDHIGSHVLSEVTEKYNPTYLIHGHLHSSNHEVETFPNEANTKIYNVSLINEGYNFSYKPLYFEI